MFAGPFRGYGQIVIIEHEGDMHSLIGGFGRMDVSVGQKVAQGEPLGLVDGPPASRRDVYFELRNQGDPIDPKPRPK
jgi:septal ring factor EnvC (AmiA/AmiB activator)